MLSSVCKIISKGFDRQSGTSDLELLIHAAKLRHIV